MLFYIYIFNANAYAAMRNNSKLKRALGAIVFSLLMAFVLYLLGFIGGYYLWSHFGPPANDPDETYALICGIIVGGLIAIFGALAILWKFWPHASLKS
jgi:hypothetical protein